MMNALTNDFGYGQPTDASSSLLTAFRERLADYAGIEVKANKDSMVCHRLSHRVSATDCVGIDHYLSLILFDPAWQSEFLNAVDMMTTNTTYFFRETVHFDFLANTVVPQLARDAGGAEFRLKLWSAAASEGAEAFTAAMVLSELQEAVPNLDFSIIGTDLSNRMVEMARLAIYRKSQTEHIPLPMRRKYLLVGQQEDVRNQVRFTPRIRSHVRFARMNLMDHHYTVGSHIDVVFLRNVLIYFSASDQRAVIDRVCSRIRTGGYLFVGLSESMAVTHPDLVQLEPGIFQKV